WQSLGSWRSPAVGFRSLLVRAPHEKENGDDNDKVLTGLSFLAVWSGHPYCGRRLLASGAVHGGRMAGFSERRFRAGCGELDRRRRAVRTRGQGTRAQRGPLPTLRGVSGSGPVPESTAK